MKLPISTREAYATLIGGAVGFAACALLGSLAPSVPATVNASKVAPTPALAPSNAIAPVTPSASPPSTISFQVGRGRVDGLGFVHFPVTLQNTGSSDFSYAELDCAFYGKDGTLLTSGMTNTTDLAAGSTTSDDITLQGASLDEIATYKCHARAH